MMTVLSSFQYVAPSTNPIYSTAFSQAGKAAYATTGYQSSQDKLSKLAETNATQVVHAAGITDWEMGGAYIFYKTYTTKAIGFPGPKLGPVKTSLTANETTGIMNFEWRFP